MTKSKELTSLILASKDRLEMLKTCVESIRKHLKDCEIVVVDDASKDGTPKWLSKQKDIVFRCNKKSVPVDKAWNQGAKIASGKYLWFSNEDVTFFNDPLPPQIKLLKEKDAGSIAQKILEPAEDGSLRIQSRGFAFSGIHQIPFRGADIPKVVDWAPFPFVRKKLVEEVGGFTVHAQLYYGDTDLGLTLQKAGYKNWYCPDASFVHHTLGAVIGSEEDKKRRKHNETVHQAAGKVSFMKKWQKWLEEEHEDLFT